MDAGTNTSITDASGLVADRGQRQASVAGVLQVVEGPRNNSSQSTMLAIPGTTPLRVTVERASGSEYSFLSTAEAALQVQRERASLVAVQPTLRSHQAVEAVDIEADARRENRFPNVG